MVQILQLDHLEYKEAILDSPEFRDKLHKHEKHISETSKNIKVLLKKLEDVINASEALRNAHDSFSMCLKDFQLGFVGDTNEEESDIVDTLDCTFHLFQDIKDFSSKMINTGHTLIRQLDNFRKDKIESFKDKKKDYERHTVRYCTALEKYLQSSQYSKREKNADESSDFREIDRTVREENQAFYNRCLDYVLCIQEFEEKWFHFFAESIFAFSQSWTTYYHEGYEKHIDYENRFNKSHGGIQALRNNFEYFKSKSKELMADILKDPEFFAGSCQTTSLENNTPITSKQGYLYLLEKKTLGSSTRVKQFCRYFKESKRLEVAQYNQTTNKSYQFEVYYVNNCQKSTSDKRFIFDISLRDKGFTNVYTYQALSYDDYKAWFAILEGKELTPILSSYSIKTGPVYLIDRNGINFIKRCIKLLEDEKLIEEGIYRKNGVSYKINQFIEKNFANIAQSNINHHHHHQTSIIEEGTAPLLTNVHSQQLVNGDQAHNAHHSFLSTVLKSANLSTMSNSSSSSALNFMASSAADAAVSTAANATSAVAAAAVAAASAATTSASPLFVSSPPSTSTATTPGSSISVHRNTSSSNLSNKNYANTNTTPQLTNISDALSGSTPTMHDLDDTCTITSALKHYLIHLKEPLMTFSFNQQFLIACRKESLTERIVEIHKLLHSLPSLNFEALDILIRHLNKVSSHSKQNKMTTSNLATCFGPTIFRAEQETVSNLYNIKFYSEIVELLIVNHDNMFRDLLDEAFLSNLLPLKTPPMMTTSTLSAHGNTSSSSNTSNGAISSSIASVNTTPVQCITPSSNLTKQRKSGIEGCGDENSCSRSCVVPSRLSACEPSYRNALLSSGAANSEADRNKPSGASLHHQQLALTLSSSAAMPGTTTIHKATADSTGTSASAHTSSGSLSSSGNGSSFLNRLSNIPNLLATHGTPHSAAALSAGNSSSGVKPYKPFNSQNSQYQQHALIGRDLSTSSGASNRSSIFSLRSSTPTSRNSNATAVPMFSNCSEQHQVQLATSTSSLNSSMTASPSAELGVNNSSQQQRTRRARTLYPCEADNPSELSFEANVIITNVRRSKESGWLEGSYDGKSGLVPGNYVQMLDD